MFAFGLALFGAGCGNGRVNDFRVPVGRNLAVNVAFTADCAGVRCVAVCCAGWCGYGVLICMRLNGDAFCFQRNVASCAFDVLRSADSTA